MPSDHTDAWTEAEHEALRAELGDFYRNRTCLVTGADGFMGSHLTQALVALGANVIAFVRATSSGAKSWMWGCDVSTRLRKLACSPASIADMKTMTPTPMAMPRRHISDSLGGPMR